MKLQVKEMRWSKKHREEYIKLFKEIQELKAKKSKDNVPKISELKLELERLQPLFFGAILTRGKEKFYMDWDIKQIKATNFSKQIKERHKEIKQKRLELKQFKINERSILGYSYDIVGGTFTKPNSVLSMQGTVSDDDRLNQTKKPLSFMKDNFIGVEIECIVKCSKEYLADVIIEDGLHRYVNLKHDGSIETEGNHNTAIEITVCAKESEINNVISRLTETLKRKRVAAKVNNSCGLHVHMDMRNRDVRESYSNLFMAQPILLGMVPANRRSSHNSWADQYCAINVKPTYDEQKTLSRRYHVINAESFNKYKTLEVRVHSGSVNATKINNWINILKSITDYKGADKTVINNVNELDTRIKLTQELKDYIIKRTDLFNNKTIDTNKDEQVA